MGRPLHFSVGTFGFPRLIEDGKYVEGLGFDSLWLGDHFEHPTMPAAPLMDSWTMLAALATHTSRIRIGTLVTNVALRHPGMLAKQAVTVDHLSGGRLEVGMGAGHNEIEHRWLGIDFLRPRDRVARLQKVVDVVDGLLRHEAIS